MKILVTGSNGQLGQTIKKLSGSYSGFHFTFTDVEELDITNLNDLKKYIEGKHFDAIINCAAYTAVDKAEEEPEQANLINAIAPGNLAKVARDNDVLLVHISTDYVFDGIKSNPYIEEDLPKPISIYAKSKADGETQIIENASKAVIFRTSWLYSEFGHNFVKTILRLANEQDSINIVNDQIGTPTFARDLAVVILDHIIDFFDVKGTDIFHYSNEGMASWFSFAQEIVLKCNIQCNVSPIQTKDYPLPAKRPFYSLMSKEKIKRQLDIHIPDWKESLWDCLVILGC